MRLTIACVGRAAKAPEQELCDSFLTRARGMGRKLGLSKLDLLVVETSRATSAAERRNEEAERLSARVAAGAHRIALDESGQTLTSEAFAGHLAQLRDAGVPELAFLIGGPDGLSGSLRDAAQERLAFGPQTWPHLLVRAMLAEQIYRAFTILSHHPYHRGR